jgi:hypothetical protein
LLTDARERNVVRYKSGSLRRNFHRALLIEVEVIILGSSGD